MCICRILCSAFISLFFQHTQFYALFSIISRVLLSFTEFNEKSRKSVSCEFLLEIERKNLLLIETRHFFCKHGIQLRYPLPNRQSNLKPLKNSQTWIWKQKIVYFFALFNLQFNCFRNGFVLSSQWLLLTFISLFSFLLNENVELAWILELSFFFICHSNNDKKI